MILGHWHALRYSIPFIKQHCKCLPMLLDEAYKWLLHRRGALNNTCPWSPSCNASPYLIAKGLAEALKYTTSNCIRRPCPGPPETTWRPEGVEEAIPVICLLHSRRRLRLRTRWFPRYAFFCYFSVKESTTLPRLTALRVGAVSRHRIPFRTCT